MLAKHTFFVAHAAVLLLECGLNSANSPWRRAPPGAGPAIAFVYGMLRASGLLLPLHRERLQELRQPSRWLPVQDPFDDDPVRELLDVVTFAAHRSCGLIRFVTRVWLS